MIRYWIFWSVTVNSPVLAAATWLRSRDCVSVPRPMPERASRWPSWLKVILKVPSGFATTATVPLFTPPAVAFTDARVLSAVAMLAAVATGVAPTEISPVVS